jgi:hypothetical protein
MVMATELSVTGRMDDEVIMSRADRIKVFGIECIGSSGSDGILFKGGEYVSTAVQYCLAMWLAMLFFQGKYTF